MSYQLGTNWSTYADKTGMILSPMVACEALSAFFLEAGFLGIMLFGRERVGPVLHMLATAMVAVGTLMSAFRILSANSWMHTPTGYGLTGLLRPGDSLAPTAAPAVATCRLAFIVVYFFVFGAGNIGFAVLTYVILDGFNLGVVFGITFLIRLAIP